MAILLGRLVVTLKISRLFDIVDPVVGPSFAPGHPTLVGYESAKVLDYLDAGAMVMFTTVRMHDVNDPGAGNVVPLSFRIDGAWVWSEATEYYLREHSLAPDPELLETIRANNFVVPKMDDETLEMAVALLQEPDEGDPVVWSHS